MKKLMLAALAVAAVAGVEAACTPGVTPTVKLPTWAYTWKFTGKTTDGALVKGVEASRTGTCTPGSIGGIPDCAIRIPASLNIQGYTYTCEPCCGGFAEFDKETFYITKPGKDWLVDDKGVSIAFANVIGKKAKEVEIAGTFTGETADSGEKYEFVFAGLGKYDLKNQRVSSASGNFAGSKMVPHYRVFDVTIGGCPEANIWNCDATDYAGAPESVAFGKWSVKFNSSAAKKYSKDGALVKAPSWMKKWYQQM